MEQRGFTFAVKGDIGAIGKLKTGVFKAADSGVNDQCVFDKFGDFRGHDKTCRAITVDDFLQFADVGHLGWQ
ncbi:hypothetical protein D3C78_1502220 [compost metagenome]